MRRLRRVVVALLLCGASGVIAGVLLQPTPAPEWEFSTWFNDDPGSLHDHRGRLVLIEFVQSRCPECDSFLIPLFRRWNDLYGEREDVLVVAVVSTLEGRVLQTPERWREYIRENRIRHPVGIDAYDGGDAVTMRRYRTDGTPHTAIVDRHGLLRFSHFGSFDPAPIEAFIERLLEEPPGAFKQWTETAGPRPSSDPMLDARLSGSYVFRVNRVTGVCAGWIPRMEVPAELRVYRDSIDVEFTRPFLGVDALEARYDPSSGQVEGSAEPAAPTAGGVGAERRLRLEGVLDRRADPPQLEFEFSLRNGKCAIQGHARR